MPSPATDAPPRLYAARQPPQMAPDGAVYWAEREADGGWTACTINGFRLGGCLSEQKALRCAARLYARGD